MLHIRDLKVIKASKTICCVPKLDIQRGENAAVIGPNGTGKTTLMRVVGGLESEFSGKCQADVPFRSRVYVHQSPYLFRGSVLFNAMYGMAAHNVPRPVRISTAREWLDKLGIGHLAERPCSHLSGGEQRRVALARAFATQAKILLLDEPLAELDQEGIDIVCRAISADRHSTILLTSPTPLPAGMSLPTMNLRSTNMELE